MGQPISPPMIIHGNPYHTDPFVRTATYVVAASDAPAHVKAQADYVCDGTDDQVEIQAAIDAAADNSRIVGLGTFHPSDNIALINPIELNIYGDIVSSAAGATFTIGSSGTNHYGGCLYVFGIVRGPHTSASTLIRHISGQYWDVKITKAGESEVANGFGKMWEFAPVAQDALTYYCGNRLTIDAWAIDNVWYIPPEPANVRIEGNKLDVAGLCHGAQPILLEGGLSNMLIGFAHSKSALPDIDDSASRGRNIFIAYYLHFPDATYNTIHQDSILLAPPVSAEAQYRKRVIVDWGKSSLVNLVTNSSFEVGDPPTDWSFAGTGNRSRSAVQVKIGTYSLMVTLTNATWAVAYQEIPNWAYYVGRTVTFGAWVYATVADRARPSIFDGSTAYYGSYHSGNPGWEWITATGTIAAAADRVRCDCLVRNGATSAYFDGAILVEGDVCPAYSPKPPLAVLTKTTTGDPAGAEEGRIIINTFDNRAKIYAEGAWRQFAAW